MEKFTADETDFEILENPARVLPTQERAISLTLT